MFLLHCFLTIYNAEDENKTWLCFFRLHHCPVGPQIRRGCWQWGGGDGLTLLGDTTAVTPLGMELLVPKGYPHAGHSVLSSGGGHVARNAVHSSLMLFTPVCL